MKRAVQICARRIDEMMGATGLATREVEGKEELQFMKVVEMTEPEASSEVDQQAIRVMRGCRKKCTQHDLSSLRTSTNVHMRSICWTMWTWYLVTQHIMSEVFLRTPLLATMF